MVVLGVSVRDLRERPLALQRIYGMGFPSVRDGEGDIMGHHGATPGGSPWSSAAS